MRQFALLVVGSLFALLVPGFAFVANCQQPPQACIQFDGKTNHYVEIPDSPDFSVSPKGLTLSAWVRPHSFRFRIFDGTVKCGYLHWLGKGSSGNQEWTFRMYRKDAHQCGTPPSRSERTSFYVFNPEGGLGVGSFFQDELKSKQWFQVVGVIDAVALSTAIYKNGAFRDMDSYGSSITPARIDPAAPLRLGTKDFASFFRGAIAELRIWNRPLTSSEVHDLYFSSLVPQNGLVAQYLLNEGEGSAVHDTVGGHLDGQVFGASWCP